MTARCDADPPPADIARMPPGVPLGPRHTVVPPLGLAHRAVTIQSLQRKMNTPWVRLEKRRDRAGTWINTLARLRPLSKCATSKVVVPHPERAKPSSAASLTEPRCSTPCTPLSDTSPKRRTSVYAQPTSRLQNVVEHRGRSET